MNWKGHEVPLNTCSRNPHCPQFRQLVGACHVPSSVAPAWLILRAAVPPAAVVRLFFRRAPSALRGVGAADEGEVVQV
jgi:hypothetical protein